MDQPAERRRHARTEFFLVPTDKERQRVWVFKPEDAAHARGALVLESNAEGMRVLVDPSEPLHPGRYRLAFLAKDAPPREVEHCIVTALWTTPDGALGHFAGLRIDERAEEAWRFLAEHRPDPEARAWPRCTIQEIAE
ncbi:MAG TPA: hypothetical protein VLT89_06240 [Usitatibacter sp.]|nr:hypothetical protein [Usitatibacter sp.]